jgi:general secretion pathway protein G
MMKATDSIRRTHFARRRARAGFTLMEVLLVLVILVVLGSIVVPMVTGIGEGASKKAAQVQVDALERMIDMYKFELKQLPTSLDDLVNEPSDPKLAKNWHQYMKANEDLIDPWDNPYKYESKGKKNAGGYDVWSMGPDGQDGTTDDIGNWKSET